MGLMDELKKIIHPYDDEDYDYEDDFEEPVKESSRSLFDDRKDDRREDRRSEDRHNKVVNIHATTQLKVVLVKPERFENASEIADHLKEKRTVVLNLESTNKDVARRLIDFLSGVAYAGGQDQEGGGQHVHHHPLLRGHHGRPDRRAGEQRTVLLKKSYNGGIGNVYTPGSFRKSIPEGVIRRRRIQYGVCG